MKRFMYLFIKKPFISRKSYAEVVLSDKPVAFYRLGEPGERDTRFAGAAKCLIRCLFTNPPAYRSADETQRIVANFCYDLMKHVLANTNSFEFGMYGDDYVIEKIPDMTEWPKESE